MHKGIRFRAEFWKKKYQSVHQQIKVKYLEEKEEEEVTLPMHAIYVCFAPI